MALLARLSREPLVHFMLIGTVIFAVAAYTDGQQPTPRDRIVITEGRIQQLVQIFTKTWQRPPTTQELRGLVDAHIKEEVYYREALKLGLDRDDTLIRRRMKQKMEFLTEPDEATLAATEDQLKAYLSKNRSEFRAAPRLAFEQIFIKPKTSAKHIAKVLEQASSTQSDVELRRLGDRTLLPHQIPLAPVHAIDRNFGQGFAQRLTQVPLNAWSGPVESTYGLHLVRVTERRDGYDPSLAEVRGAVERKWRDDKRAAFQAAEYERLRNRYAIVLPDTLAGKQAAKVSP